MALRGVADPPLLEGFTSVSEGGTEQNDAFSFWKLPESWREALQPMIETSRVTAEWYLYEGYLSDAQRRPPRGISFYYLLKKMMPRWLRHNLNATVIRFRRANNFPAWPREPTLVLFWREWLEKATQAVGGTDSWHIGFWPYENERCIVLTHDVESPLGFDRMEEMAAIEDRYGFRSAWNLPLGEYPINWTKVESLRARGFEFGAHGIKHDGRLFSNLREFKQIASKIEALAREHQLKGFRAPSTLRRIDWLQRMGFDHDSTYSDTDPFEPQPGGTCSIFPFFIGKMVELPYTLPQDHTLIHLLRRDPIPVWTEKLEWIAGHGGMILSLVHSDYCGSPQYVCNYVELLKRLNDLEAAWRALPSEVSAWWRRRSAMKLVIRNGEPIIVGPETSGARAERLSANALVNRS